MGPSVNLSARLMGFCKLGGILVDKSIMETDQVHEFTTNEPIAMKGFSEPMTTYSPVFKKSNLRKSISSLRMV